MSRPELIGHASLYYNSKEARKYNSSSRIIGVQREITERSIELLRLPTSKPSYILDIGCGSGLSGQVLEENGHVWVGCDISRDMIDIARERFGNDTGKMEEDEEDATMKLGDLLHHDMGTGLPFRPASFDACISISAVQWLCYSNSNKQVPKKRLMRFFSSLYSVLRRGGRAVLQFYPETAEQAVLISECAAKVGFGGGIVIDYPNSTKAKKHYLVLSSDKTSSDKTYKSPSGLTTDASLLHKETVQVDNNNLRSKNKHSKKSFHKKKHGAKTKEWILNKKETQRNRGNQVRPDTKYTGRKRPTRF